MKTMKLVLAFVLVGMTRLAFAEYLYWQIGETNTIEFDYAILYAVNDHGDKFDDGNCYGTLDQEGNFVRTTTTGPQQTQFGENWNWEAYSYCVELFTWDSATEKDLRVGYSETATYAQLADEKMILPSGMSIPDIATPWTPATTVPEPSSAMMILFGLAFIGLKRRRGI